MNDNFSNDDPRPIVWTRELVDRFWNGLSKAQLDDVMSFGRMAKRCIYWLVARKLVLGGRHLDYGAGGGEVAMYLMQQGYPFAVHEPSVERQKKTENRLKDLPSFLGKAAEPGSESYDTVTCFEVLEHVLDEDLERVCDELAGHVKPGGHLIVSTPNNEDFSRDTVYCPVSNLTFHRWQHVRQVSPAFMESHFSRRGFSKICLHQLDFSEGLFEPFLHFLGIQNALADPNKIDDPMPLHIHQILHDMDGIMGGATRILYIGKKQSMSSSPGQE